MLKKNIQVSDKKFTRLLSTMSSPDCSCSIFKHNAVLWYTYRLMHSASELSGFMRTSLLTNEKFMAVHVTMDVLLAFRLLEGNHQRYKPWYSNWTDTMPSLTDFISDISEWLMFLLFAVFSATYFKEFRDLGIEMSCFSTNSGRQQGTSIKKYSRMLMQRDSADSDED